MIELSQLPKACVILGAGASADVWNGSSPRPQGDTYRPPLARDLFAIGRHPEYFQILQLYPAAQSLAARLSPPSENTTFNLEMELRKLAEHPDARVRRQFRYVPPYLRHLIWHVSHEYTPTPGTYLQLVYALLADKPHHVLFVVMNYDTLLEQALTMFDPELDFNDIHDYVRHDRQAKVVKLHGSVNWFKSIGASTQPWETLVDSEDVLQKVEETKIRVFDGGDPLMSMLISGNRPYPVLTAPLAGKGLADMVCPQSHVSFAKEFLKDCAKFLIIGTSGLDEDLLALLDEAVPATAQPAIHFVGRSDAEKALARYEQAVKAFHFERETPPDFLFKNGFRSYVDGSVTRFSDDLEHGG